MMDIPRLALSVRQPWAHALAAGWKPVENRSWRRDYPAINFRGPFAIHAASGMTRAEYEEASETFELCGFVCPLAADLQRGGIIGVASVVDIVTEHESRWFFGPKGLVIAGARPVDFIAVGGRLGFFDWRELLPFIDRSGPMTPARWMLPDAARPAPPIVGQDQQGRLL